MTEIYLSVVIPAYNERARIGKSLEAIVNFLSRQSYRSEIIVVDDGSSDGSDTLIEQKLGSFPHRLLRNPRNRGKGYSVKRGVLEAEGQFIFFTDADLSTSIDQIQSFLAQLVSGDYDCVIGSRDLPGSKVGVHQSWARETMGKVFNRMARFFSFHGIHDSQCGFKCFRREAARDLFAAQKIDGFSFDAEILYLAQKRGYRILESPVSWSNSPQTRVNMWLDPWKMLWDLVRIRWLHRQDNHRVKR